MSMVGYILGLGDRYMIRTSPEQDQDTFARYRYFGASLISICTGIRVT